MAIELTHPVKASRSRLLEFTAWSPRRAALIAGVALALMAVLGGVGNFGAIAPLISPGDAVSTASAISDSRFLFLAGIAMLYVVILLDFIVSGAWYTLFRPVHRRLSAAAAWLRIVYTVLFAVAISQLVVGFTLLDDPEAALPAFESFSTIWLTSLGLFGIHLLMVGYLAFHSTFIARTFGILLAVAGLGYIADAVGVVADATFPFLFASFAFVGEVAMIFWLLIKGRRFPARCDAISKTEGQGRAVVAIARA
ncbi:MAG TPA: DUF4386 domain-containing protein [Marisediminicola sp.]|jgi:hypothetical protein|nr:DUF4386 domain-containing protein [Marisediminicola sp.]